MEYEKVDKKLKDHCDKIIDSIDDVFIKFNKLSKEHKLNEFEYINLTDFLIEEFNEKNAESDIDLKIEYKTFDSRKFTIENIDKINTFKVLKIVNIIADDIFELNILFNFIVNSLDLILKNSDIDVNYKIIASEKIKESIVRKNDNGENF